MSSGALSPSSTLTPSEAQSLSELPSSPHEWGVVGGWGGGGGEEEEEESLEALEEEVKRLEKKNERLGVKVRVLEGQQREFSGNLRELGEEERGVRAVEQESWGGVVRGVNGVGGVSEKHDEVVGGLCESVKRVCELVGDGGEGVGGGEEDEGKEEEEGEGKGKGGEFYCELDMENYASAEADVLFSIKTRIQELLEGEREREKEQEKKGEEEKKEKGEEQEGEKENEGDRQNSNPTPSPTNPPTTQFYEDEIHRLQFSLPTLHKSHLLSLLNHSRADLSFSLLSSSLPSLSPSFKNFQKKILIRSSPERVVEGLERELEGVREELEELKREREVVVGGGGWGRVGVMWGRLGVLEGGEVYVGDYEERLEEEREREKEQREVVRRLLEQRGREGVLWGCLGEERGQVGGLALLGKVVVGYLSGLGEGTEERGELMRRFGGKGLEGGVLGGGDGKGDGEGSTSSSSPSSRSFFSLLSQLSTSSLPAHEEDPFLLDLLPPSHQLFNSLSSVLSNTPLPDLSYLSLYPPPLTNTKSSLLLHLQTLLEWQKNQKHSLAPSPSSSSSSSSLPLSLSLPKQQKEALQLLHQLLSLLFNPLSSSSPPLSLRSLSANPSFTPPEVVREMGGVEGSVGDLTKEVEGVLRERGERMAELQTNLKEAQISRNLYIYFFSRPDALPALFHHYQVSVVWCVCTLVLASSLTHFFSFR